jgi:2-dehydro-3-deoxyglucarate aldolase
MKNLKDRMKKRELTIGSWVTFSDPAVAEIMARAGFDWLTLDMEHSGLSTSQAQEIIRVIDLCGVPPLVRVMENHPEMLKRYMDMGAHGVIVPFVNSKEDAQKAVKAVKYPPAGTRGVGLARAQRYSLDLETYRRWNQENSIVIVQIEHVRAVENLEAIMDVEGVDGMIIGPYDLSSSMGCPGQFDHRDFKDALQDIYRRSRSRNYLLGHHVVTPDLEKLRESIGLGARFVGFGTDFLFLGESCKTALRDVKKP